MKSKTKTNRSVPSSHCIAPGGARSARGRRWYLVSLVVVLLLAGGCRLEMHDQPRYEPLEATRDGKPASRHPVEGTVPRSAEIKGGQTMAANGLAPAAGAPTGLPGGATSGAASTEPIAAAQGVAGQPTQAAGASTGTQPAGTGTAAAAATQSNTFPFPITVEVLNRGEVQYNVSCSICHGKTGYGDGMIVRRGFRPPPSLHSDRLRQAPVSHYYDVITNGFGAMPSYWDQVRERDRYAIIAYIRALQLSQNATQADVPPAELEKLNSGGQPR